MKALLMVAMGGCCGAVCRWRLGAWIDQHRGSLGDFPLGILAANVFGCFLFGWLFGLGENRSWMTSNLRLLIFTGFLGSFTTFSTFSWNTLELLKSAQFGMALLNIGVSILLGLGAVWIGFCLAGLPR